MATDRDRFGHRLGKTWKKVRDLVAYSPSQADSIVAEYLDSALLRRVHRRGFEQLLQSLSRADTARDTRLLRTDDPEYASSVAAIRQCDPYVAQMALEALRIAEAEPQRGAVDALVNVTVRWLTTQCLIQKPYSGDNELQATLSERSEQIEGLLRSRWQSRAQHKKLHKPKHRTTTADLMHLSVTVVH